MPAVYMHNTVFSLLSLSGRKVELYGWCRVGNHRLGKAGGMVAIVEVTGEGAFKWTALVQPG